MQLLYQGPTGTSDGQATRNLYPEHYVNFRQAGIAFLAQLPKLPDECARRWELTVLPLLDQLAAGAGAILLAHEPDFADFSALTGPFALQLSGHSHGGQISLPLLGAPILPPFGRKYPRGRYQVGEMIQYTNRGLGMVQPYGRFNCRPEITLFILRAGG